MTQPPQRPPAASGRRSPRERRARDRRILALGLSVSALLHALFIVLVSGWLEPETAPPPSGSSAIFLEPPTGMRAVQLRVLSPSAPETTPQPAEPRELREPAPEPASEMAAALTSADSLPADSRSAADRLAPRVVDPRLWEPMILIPREPTLAEVEARIAAAVELLSDSALAEADAAIRAVDWTVKDAKGGKWGVSPGKLHLGGVTLPLPIWFPEDPEAVAAQAQWYELDQQLERTRILESFEDRVRAIRERRERERSEARGGGSGG